MKCPAYDNLQRCTAIIDIRDVETLLDLSQQVLGKEAALTREEAEKFNKFNAIAAIPIDQRMYCPSESCGGLIVVPEGCERGTQLNVQCPYCEENFCVNCKVAWHEGLTCEAYLRYEPLKHCSRSINVCTEKIGERLRE